MLSRKHYVVIARVIKDSTFVDNHIPTINKAKLINGLSIVFKQDNSLFNSDRFIDACDGV